MQYTSETMLVKSKDSGGSGIVALILSGLGHDLLNHRDHRGHREKSLSLLTLCGLCGLCG